MDTNELFEAEAEAFYRATGMFAPSQYPPPALNLTHSPEERLKRFEEWHKTNCLSPALKSSNS